MSFENKKNKWKDLKDKLVGSPDALYEHVLEQYSGWLNGFYAFFGVDDFGQAKVSDLPEDHTSEQLTHSR